MICRKCGAEIPDGQEKCDHCGTNVDQIFGGLVDFFAPVSDKPRRNYMAFWGVGVGIATFMFGFVPGLNYISFFTGVHGIVFSILGLTMKRVVPSKRYAVSGLILNIVGLIAASVVLYLMQR